MVSVCLHADALSQHLPSYLGFSYLGHGVSLYSCSSKAQPPLLTLDMEYLLSATAPDLGCGVSPLGCSCTAHPPLLWFIHSISPEPNLAHSWHQWILMKQCQFFKHPCQQQNCSFSSTLSTLFVGYPVPSASREEKTVPRHWGKWKLYFLIRLGALSSHRPKTPPWTIGQQ